MTLFKTGKGLNSWIIGSNYLRTSHLERPQNLGFMDDELEKTHDKMVLYIVNTSWIQVYIGL